MCIPVPNHDGYLERWRESSRLGLEGVVELKGERKRRKGIGLRDFKKLESSRSWRDGMSLRDKRVLKDKGRQSMLRMEQVVI